ncbi:hypothetical protein Nepgr_019254 [Nepenthes gracilis]|uniref:Uncharacterized protein n=1 Tax=Nepenthes gracilis TaxID=150966 RepID=A0AAD3XU71_NEPGR|nr:hypothetical protein Nepgr_019254 [Nepenthes gracilis]
MKNWTTPYLRYLVDETLPEDAEQSWRIKRMAGWYTIVDGRLYRRGYSTRYLHCLTREEEDFVLSEVHLAIYGSYMGEKNLAFKIMRGLLLALDEKECTRVCKKAVPHFGGIPPSEWTGRGHEPNATPWAQEQDEGRRGSWVNELASLLWSYQTTPKKLTRETPFSLYYETEVVIPVKIGLPSLRVKSFDPQSNSQKIREHLDLLEEACDAARIRAADYQY